MNANPKTGLVLLLVGTLLLAAAAGSAEFKPRKSAIKPAEASIAPGFSRRHVEVKFVDELDIGLSSAGVPYDRADQVLKSRGADVVQSITAAGGGWTRSSVTAEDMVDFLVARAERRLSRDIADLNNYFVLTVPEGIATEDWIDQLNSLPEVEIALAMPLGYGMVLLLARAYDTELFRMPIFWRARTVVLTALLSFLFVLIAQWFVYHQVRKLDWLEGIKVRE